MTEDERWFWGGSLSLRVTGWSLLLLGLGAGIFVPWYLPPLVTWGSRYFSADGVVTATGIWNLQISLWSASFVTSLVGLGFLRLARTTPAERLQLWRLIFADQVDGSGRKDNGPTRGFQDFRPRPKNAPGPSYRQLAAATSLTAASFLLFILGDGSPRWVGEDGLAEYLQVLLVLLSAGILSIILARFHRSLNPLATSCFALLTVGGVFYAGEEISWGQRLFGWQTPEGWAAINLQGETTLHNLIPNLPVTYLLVGLAGLSVILWTVRKQLGQRWTSDDRIVLPHPALGVPLLGYLVFNVFPVVGALWPWGELQELLLAECLALYAWEKLRLSSARLGN